MSFLDRSAGDLLDLTVRGPIGEVRLVGPRVGGLELLVGGEFVAQLAHDVVGLEHRHRGRGGGVGEVVERGERRAVGQPWRGGDDRGVPAHAASGDAHDSPGGSAELLAQHGEVGLARRGEGLARHVGKATGARL